MKKGGFVYIMTNKRHRVLYTGVTNDLVKRAYQHKHGLIDGFTKRYKVKKLVYFEIFNDIQSAIEREKRIKDGSRQKKIDLINSMNPDWRDLSDEFL